MYKIFMIFTFISGLLLLFTGCSRAHVQRDISNNMPTRSAERSQPRSYPQPTDTIYSSTGETLFSDALAPEKRISRGRATSQQTSPSQQLPPVQQAPPAQQTANQARYETKFDASDTARANNIALAARSINGTVVQPGEEFSYNDTIGSTTAEFGYQEAVVFKGGKKSRGFGGGVCQVSTTLANAAKKAGMNITERHDHSLPVNYEGDGIEAATSNSGDLDFKFKNPHAYPVTIYANAENGVVWASVS